MKSKYRLVQYLSIIVTKDLTCKEYKRKELKFLYAHNGTQAPWQWFSQGIYFVAV